MLEKRLDRFATTVRGSVFDGVTQREVGVIAASIGVEFDILMVAGKFPANGRLYVGARKCRIGVHRNDSFDDPVRDVTVKNCTDLVAFGVLRAEPVAYDVAYAISEGFADYVKAMRSTARAVCVAKSGLSDCERKIRSNTGQALKLMAEVARLQGHADEHRTNLDVGLSDMARCGIEFLGD